jgi:phosphatidate cytidylyltransferase
MIDWLTSLAPTGQISLLALASMTLGSLVRLLTLRGLPQDQAASRLASLRTWWILLGLLIAACWIGPYGIVLLLALASGLAMDEFLRIAAPMVTPIPRRLWALTMVLTGYGSLVLFEATTFQTVVPLIAIWTLVLPHLIGDSTQSYLSHVGYSLWGVMVLVWGVGHAALIALQPLETNSPGVAVGGFMYLVLVTEMNDIAQAWIGRAWGRHKILPHVSPHKTWEGFIGGLLVTSLLSVGLSLWLMPDLGPTAGTDLHRNLPWLGSWLAGLVIGLSGFVGDLNMSCVKRDAGVKDGSQFLPGQGGVIDRIDSLSFTAPALVLFLHLW